MRKKETKEKKEGGEGETKEKEEEVEESKEIEEGLLILAVEKDDKDEVRQLIAKGVSVDIINEYGKTPLIIAILNSNTDMVELLIELGADITKPNKKNMDIIPFILACKRGLNDIVKILISAGADVNQKVNFHNGREEPLIHYIIDNMKSSGYLPNANHIEVIKTLINADTSRRIINIKDDNGDTAIMFAIRKICQEKEYMKLIYMLINMGADLNIKNDNGKTFVDLAYSYCGYDMKTARKFYDYVKNLNNLGIIASSYEKSKSKEKEPTLEAPLAGIYNMVDDSDEFMKKVLDMI